MSNQNLSLAKSMSASIFLQYSTLELLQDLHLENFHRIVYAVRRPAA